jgi:hypothetical protein
VHLEKRTDHVGAKRGVLVVVGHLVDDGGAGFRDDPDLIEAALQSHVAGRDGHPSLVRLGEDFLKWAQNGCGAGIRTCRHVLVERAALVAALEFKKNERSH